MSPARIDLTTFVRRLSEEFEWKEMEVTSESNLIEDCGMDSMAMYEMLLLLEEQGFYIDEEDLFGWSTIGDVYDACLRKMDQ